MAPKLGEVIENIGMGPAQLRNALLGGGIWLADGAELLLISSVGEALELDWHLTPMEKGLLVTLVFVGILLGNLTSGPVGDRFGRRGCVVASFFGIFIFSVISALTQNVGQLCIVRCVVGFTIGLGQPAWNSLCAEITPPSQRMLMQTGTQMLFCAGELYSAMLLFCEDPTMKPEYLSWRWLLAMGSIPSGILAVLSYLFLYQSPSYLALTGRYADAKAVLEHMKYMNSSDADTDFEPLERLEFKTAWDTFVRQMSVIFSSSRCYTTFTLMYSCFVLNFLYYGSLYVFPQVLPKMDLGGTAAMELFIGALVEIPGILLGYFLSLHMDRIPVMKLTLAASAVCVFVFGMSTAFRGSRPVTVFANLAYFGIKIFPDAAFLVFFQYLAEYFPTEARNTGTSVAMSGGRIGSMIVPIVAEALHNVCKSWSVFFFVTTALAAIAYPLIANLPTETKGIQLQDRDDEKEAESLKCPEAYGATKTGSKASSKTEGVASSLGGTEVP